MTQSQALAIARSAMAMALIFQGAASTLKDHPCGQ